MICKLLNTSNILHGLIINKHFSFIPITFEVKITCETDSLLFAFVSPKLKDNLVPSAISAFKMAGGRKENPGEEQVTCLQKYWRFWLFQNGGGLTIG